MELKNFFLQDLSGNVIPDATVYLYEPGTETLATGLQDKDGGALSNPFTAGATGLAQLAAPDGEYDLRAVGAGRDTTLRVRFIDSVAGSAALLRADLGSTDAGKGAELVSFLQAGAGAIARTALAKMMDFVSVADFGAVGDGAANDTAAIQAAIDHVASIGGGTIYFPAGTFIVRQGATANVGILLKSNIMLRGAGVGATTIKADDGAGNIHLITNSLSEGTEYVGITDMTVDHNGMNLGTTTSVHTIRLNSVNHIWIQRIAVKNTDHHAIVSIAADGLSSDANTDCFIDNVYLENIGVNGWNGGDGIRIFYGADRLVISNIIGNGIEYHGIHCGKGNGVVSNVILKNCGNTGLSIESEGVIASNIHIEWDAVISDTFANIPAAGVPGRLFRSTSPSGFYRDNGAEWKTLSANFTGVWVFTRPGGYPTAQRIMLSGIKCVFAVDEQQPYTPGVGDGIRVEGPQVQISNCLLQGKFRFGILVASGSDHLQVSNAIIDGARLDGVRLGACTFPVLHNVSILSAGVEAPASNYGINLRGTTNARISNSFVEDASLLAGINESLGTESGTRITNSHFTKNGCTTTGVLGAAHHNTGWTSNNTGNATIASGATSVVVNHGISASPAPGQISIIGRENPTNNVGTIWISGITSTQFTVNVQSDPGASGWDFAWKVSRG